MIPGHLESPMGVHRLNRGRRRCRWAGTSQTARHPHNREAPVGYSSGWPCRCKRLVRARGSLVDPLNVCRGDRVVGRVFDRQRNGNTGGRTLAVGVRIVQGPLRQPRPQGREPRQAHGAAVHGLGMPEIGVPCPAVVGFEGSRKRGLVRCVTNPRVASLLLEPIERLPQCGPSANPRTLSRSEMFEKVRRIRRPRS